MLRFRKINNYLLLSCPLAMTTRLLWRALCLLAPLCTMSPFSSADNPDPSAPEQGVTFSHVYKIDIPGSSSCKLEHQPTQDETGHSQKTRARENTSENNYRQKKGYERSLSMCMPKDGWKYVNTSHTGCWITVWLYCIFNLQM